MVGSANDELVSTVTGQSAMMSLYDKLILDHNKQTFWDTDADTNAGAQDSIIAFLERCLF